MPGVNSIKLLTGNSHPELALMVADRLGIPLTQCVCKKFADQSIDVRIGASVRDEDVFVLQTGNSPNVDPNDCLMELLIIINACKTASARRITAVIPSYPYARHDKKDKSRAPITAKMVANMISVAGANHVITMDLHASQIQGFFDIPVDNLTSEPSIARWIRSYIPDYKNCIIVSPDAGGAKRATSLADLLNVDFALINRNRKREQNRRLREQIRAQKGLSTQSSNSDFHSGMQTPMTGSFIVDHAADPTSSEVQGLAQRMLPSTSQTSLRDINNELENISLQERRSLYNQEDGSILKTPISSSFDHNNNSARISTPLANGIYAGDKGEWITYDENGHKIVSGGGTPLNSVSNGNNFEINSNSLNTTNQVQDDDGKEEVLEILVGDVKGKTAILLDDMIDTAKTLALATKTLQNGGARKVYAFVSHGLLSGKATDLIRILNLEKLVVTNSIQNREKIILTNGKLEILDISAVISESIRRTHNGESISLLFQEDAALLF